jgi:PAS domain S-box-containing protein
MMSVAGKYKISDYSPETLIAIKSGSTVVNCDAANDPRTADIYKTTYEPYSECAYVSIPLFTGNQWTAVFWISHDKPRKWTPREIAFLEAAGERAWLAIEKLRNEEALRLSEERMRLATEAAEIYTWEFDLETQKLAYAENTERVLGFSMPEDWSQATLLIFEKDRQNAVDKFEQAFANETNFNLDFRLVNPEAGNIIWQSVQGIFITSKDRKSKRFIGITQNITERKKAEQEREELLRREHSARLQAEEANRLKDEFLATVSHELRTPLNAILGWSQMLASGKFNGGDISRPLETIYRNAKSQAQLVEDILDVSRIITGKLRIEPESVSLAAIIQSAVETLRPALEAKNIRLQLQMNHELQALYADPDRLQQVVWNLLSNAIKFTPDKGQVTIALERRAGEIILIVSDTGKGISPEFLPFVFERFRQADGTSTRSHGGLGLGLAIVRHIVELHGGTVEAKSEGDDMGTTFIVRLPLSEKDLIAGN